MIPDIEKIVTKYLKADDGVAAITDRIVGKPPDDQNSTPWIQVMQLNAPQNGDPDHLVPFFIQFDCYVDAPDGDVDEGGGQPLANLMGRTLRAALGAMREADHDDADVTDVVIIGDRRLPDTTFEPARERRILEANIYAHAS